MTIIFKIKILQPEFHVLYLYLEKIQNNRMEPKRDTF